MYDGARGIDFLGAFLIFEITTLRLNRKYLNLRRGCILFLVTNGKAADGFGGERTAISMSEI